LLPIAISALRENLVQEFVFPLLQPAVIIQGGNAGFLVDKRGKYFGKRAAKQANIQVRSIRPSGAVCDRFVNRGAVIQEEAYGFYPLFANSRGYHAEVDAAEVKTTRSTAMCSTG
jgi:hypothetical protein